MMRALQLNRPDTLEIVYREQNSGTIFSTHPALPQISKILKDSWRMNIATDNQLDMVFDKPSMIAYNQPPQSNLHQLLTESKECSPALNPVTNTHVISVQSIHRSKIYNTKLKQQQCYNLNKLRGHLFNKKTLYTV